MDLTPDGRVRWHDPFIAELAKTGLVGRSCEVAAISKTAAYDHRQKFPDFARRWAEAINKSIETLEAEARRRALEGVSKYVISRGAPVEDPEKPGEYLRMREYSDQLMMFLLRAHRPAVYRDRHDVKVQVGVTPLTDLMAKAENETPDWFRRKHALETSAGVTDAEEN